ncbi:MULTISPECIES: hypothetical protein [Actinomadura]|uniref:DUF4175 domain-containing protein n=1 Tax=Actinomadura yumaensis TaxID=111807 RepID=A0ABW2CSC8_9ACTN|nr:hypothetical protein [Actinomadura sp. J1-007]MWK35208.1 hypothetical protein [Actinomadura sp. J1-007]
MYAWLWRHLPGRWQARTALAVGLALAFAAVLWYLVFPWVEPKVQFDHGVVDGTPASSTAPTAPATPG